MSRGSISRSEPGSASRQRSAKRTRKRTSAQGSTPISVLDKLVAIKIMQLSETILHGVAQIYEAKFGIKNTELRILMYLKEHKGLSVNELGRQTGIDKGWVSRSLESMLKRGLVSRAAHATDSRVMLMSLSSQGEDLVREIMPIALARNARFLEGLNADEFLEMLAKLHERAKQMIAEEERASRTETLNSRLGAEG